MFCQIEPLNFDVVHLIFAQLLELLGTFYS
jgi:hypothetical protein